MSELLCRLITLTAGTLYPAYRSYKAVRTKDVREYVKWMMYWIVFALYCFAETVADTLLAFWFPFYFQLKIVFVLWLLSPWTKGASILYRKWIHPMLSKHEDQIDALLEQAKSESYNQVLRIGSRTLLCARDIVAEAAIRGQQQLVNQLQKSYSMNDVSSAGDRKLRDLKETEEIHVIEEQEGSDPESREDEPEVRSRVVRTEEIQVEPLIETKEKDKVPRRRRQRSGSRSRNLEGTENTYNTMPRRNPRRH